MQELLAKLVSFKTTADRPEEIKRGFEYIASLFDKDKFDIQMPEKNGKYSLLVSFKGKDALRPKILLNGHFDVVPAESKDQFEMKVQEGRAYGRGTVDMKGMAAVLIEVMLELCKQEEQPDVALLLNGDEEIGGKDGAGYMVKDIGMRPQFVLCGDGTFKDAFKITTKEKGALWLEILAKGKTAHGAYVWEGENAVEKVVEAVKKIKNFIGQVEPRAWKSTVNFGVVETTNKTPNKVPAEARAVLDIRFTEETARTPDDLFAKIKELVPGVQLNPLAKNSLLFVEEHSPFLLEFAKTAGEILGEEPVFAFAHGATDARYFGEVGIPAVIFGAKGENMHASEEWVDLDSLEKNKEILLKFLSK